MWGRASTYLHQRPKLILALLLGPPLLYMLVVYLGSLFALLVNSFFYLEEFTVDLRPGHAAGPSAHLGWCPLTCW